MDTPLERGFPVEITLDGGWQLSATVDSVAAGHLDLKPVVAQLGGVMLPGDLRWCPATVSWRTRVGAATHSGVLACGDDGIFRLHSVAVPEHVQRRNFVRVPADLTIAVIGGDARVVTRTLDISVGGMLLCPADSIETSDLVRFAIDLGPMTVTGVGEVVRATSEGARAIRFAELGTETERELSRYVARRQRELAHPAA